MRFSIVVVLLGSCLMRAPAQNQPAAHWRLDETMGTTANDSSPNANTGTLVGFGAAPWTTGVHGGALSFAAAQHVNCAVNGGIPMYDGSGAPFTFTAWVNGPPQDDDRIYSEGSSTNNNPLYTIGSGRNVNGTADRLQLFVRNDTGGVQINLQTTTPVFDSTWHHVAVVDVAGNVSIYVDGVLDATAFNYTPNTNTGIDRVSLGAVLRAGTCCNYTGMLDDVRMYPFALSAPDITTVLNDQPLIAGFQTNQPGASLVVDGKVSSPFSAAPADLMLGQAFDMTVSSNLAGNNWEMGVDTVAAIPNAVTYVNNTINIQLSSPTLTLVNGGFQSSFGVAPGLPGATSGSGFAATTLSLTAPGTPTLICVQFGVLDPSNIDGFVVSGPANINVN